MLCRDDETPLTEVSKSYLLISGFDSRFTWGSHLKEINRGRLKQNKESTALSKVLIPHYANASQQVLRQSFHPITYRLNMKFCLSSVYFLISISIGKKPKLLKAWIIYPLICIIIKGAKHFMKVWLTFYLQKWLSKIHCFLTIVWYLGHKFGDI